MLGSVRRRLCGRSTGSPASGAIPRGGNCKQHQPRHGIPGRADRPSVLVIDAVRHGAAAIVGAGVFAATMALLYLTSTLYHALAPNRAKRVFQILDHVAIYLLIAGTYTPFTLGVLWGPWGWTLFGLIWALAVAGIVLNRSAEFDTLGFRLGSTWSRMVDSGRGKAVVARDAWVGSLLARGRRCRVHGGGWILCRQPDAVRPLCVAPVRTRGHGMSLHCRATIRGLSGAFALLPRASQSCGVVPHPRPVRAGRVALQPYQQTGFCTFLRLSIVTGTESKGQRLLILKITDLDRL